MKEKKRISKAEGEVMEEAKSDHKFDIRINCYTKGIYGVLSVSVCHFLYFLKYLLLF